MNFLVYEENLVFFFISVLTEPVLLAMIFLFEYVRNLKKLEGVTLNVYVHCKMYRAVGSLLLLQEQKTTAW